MTLVRPSAGPDLEEVIEVPPVELAGTLWPLAHGIGDPTIRFAADGIWRSTRFDDGAATLRMRALSPGALRVQAWGPGASVAVANVFGIVGGQDDPGALVPQHRILRDTMRRHPDLRLPRTHRIFDALLPAILEQKVTGVEARKAFRALIHRYGERAPGPARLWLPPAPDRIAELPYHAFHPLGVEQRRAEVIRASARQARRLEAAPTPTEAARLLRAIPGIGPWTTAEVLRVAWGDPDAVSVGDFHIPNLVAWALAGEPRADDARMLELLAPYLGQRGRVQRLLEASGVQIPRYGPRMSPRWIAEI
jgi:3-methyladenine DNA glycosylase/8-oxoguanine DNA glycosylase